MLSVRMVVKYLIAILCVLIVIGSAMFPCLLVVVTPLFDWIFGRLFDEINLDHIIILFVRDYFHIFIISPTVNLPFVVEVTEYVHFALYFVYQNLKHLLRILLSLLWQ